MNVFEAIEANDVDRVRELARADPRLGKQRDEAGVSALLAAQYYGRDEIAAELVLPNRELDVFEAAAYGRTERLRELLDADESLANAWSSDGFQPLGLAVFFAHPEAARLLLDRGADPRTPARHAQIKAAPIHSAAAASDVRARRALAELLLDHGADPSASQENGFTALHAAAQHGDLELARLLLDRGADSRAETDDGRAPAAIAREQGNGELAKLLGD